MHLASLSRLSFLDIGFNPIGDRGLAIVSRLIRLETLFLRKLWVYSEANRIKEGAVHLHSLKQLKRLTYRTKFGELD